MNISSAQVAATLRRRGVPIPADLKKAAQESPLVRKFMDAWGTERVQPVREYKFHRTRNWRLDLAWFSKNPVIDPFTNFLAGQIDVPICAVEIHGATYDSQKTVYTKNKFGGINIGRKGRGRHVRGKGFDNDREKINAATLQGWDVYELTASMLRDMPSCIALVEKALEARR